MELHGTQGADVLTGGAGDDTIYGFAGNDTLKGLDGNDVLAGNEGNDILQGGNGDDYLLGGPGDDTLDGGAGNDWAAYEDATAGVTVNLNLTGAQNTGGGGTDKLISIENLYGSAFNDTLTGDAHDNMMVGGDGNDTLIGNAGDDTLWGSAGNDTLDGGDGDDYLVGGAGDDVIKGGAGHDWASYEDATAGVTVDLTKTGPQDTGGAGKDTLSSIENLYGSKYDDTLTGDAGDNYLWGGDGNDRLFGGAGDDHLSGGAGVNLIDGGAGFDTVDYAFAEQGVTVDLSNGTTTGGATDTLVSIEAVMGSTHDDVITGNASENYLFGDAGNDVLYAVGGNDTLDGGDGNDVLRGSFHKPGDMLLGGAGDDLVIVFPGPGSEGVTTVDGGVGNDTLLFSTASDITFDLRNTGDQVVAPGIHMVVQNIENVTGGAGNDHLTGDAGNNVISGGAGDDVLDGGAGFDIASYEGGPGVRVDLSKTGPQDTHGAGVDTLINFEGLKGSSLNDVLIGDAKDNTLQGGAGNDILDGGAGVDTAIFTGASTDYTWTKNSNGTWTVKGLDGVDTLLNIEKLQFSDKIVTLSSSAATVTVDDLVKTKVLVSSATGDLRDAVISPDGGTAYVSDKDGYVSVIDTATGQLKAHLKVGTDLGGMDVSTDGQSLVVTDRLLQDERTSPGGAYSAKATVHVVNLTTGGVSDYSKVISGAERAFYDAAFLGDGTIALSQSSSLPSLGLSPSLQILDTKTSSFTPTPVTPQNNAILSVSDDKMVLLGTQPGLSSGPTFVVTTGKGMTAASDGYTTGFSGGIQAISRDGSHIAQVLDQNKIYLYDAALHHTSALVEPTNGFRVAGMDFSPDGQHLFVVDAVSGSIFEYGASDLSLENVYSLGLTGLGGANAFGDSASISADGGHMLIFDGSSVISVNLTGLTPDGGTGHADILTGTDGADILQGHGGNDVITGGKGTDTLIGGAGDDTFRFAKGDSLGDVNGVGVDVIQDFQAGDKLQFDEDFSGKVSFVKSIFDTYYSAQYAANFTLFAAGAPTTIQVYQVASDSYVFVGHTEGTTGHLDNVVKLTGVSAASVDLSAFGLAA